MKPSSNPPSYSSYIIASTDGGTHDLDLRWILSDNKIRGKVGTENGSAQAWTSVIPDTNWHHVVFTWEKGGSVRMYYDGSLCEANAALNETNTYIDLFIGGLNERGLPQTDTLFNGMIDEVGFWERELSATEVSYLYNNGSGLGYP